jgi:cellulose synthase/poly-beta-1,6-N-acetylglucosamine synthase-like glycosyltransferase
MQTLPFISIIMPTRNESHYIRRSLGSVFSQDYPADRLEILVVDGMSDDGTRQIVQQMSGGEHAIATQKTASDAVLQRRPSTILLDNPRLIAPTAFNIGLSHARGDIIIIVGGHSELAADYVRRCVEVLQQTGADCVGGSMVTMGETSDASTIALAQSARFGVGGVAFRTGREHPGYVDTVAFGAYRREVFDRIGGFDEELVRNQDDELNFRLTQAGGKIWLDPSICCVYYSRASFRRLWRQYFQYGEYKVRVIQKRGAVPSWRHLVPAAFVLSLCLSLVLSLVTRRRFWALLIIGPYAASTAAASVWTARRNWRTLPLLPRAFLTLHFAYGLGFLAGLWRWRKHNHSISIQGTEQSFTSE